jgi:hypothetical protein
MVAVAEPDFVASACEIALMVTVGGTGTILGAVYVTGFALTLFSVPQAFPLHPSPESVHVTAGFELLETVAVNWAFCPARTFAVDGVIVTRIEGEVIVTKAEPDLLGSACEMALTMTVEDDGTFCGAVKIPFALIVPCAASPPVTSFTCQVTL